jgi:hypothetical protein
MMSNSPDFDVSNIFLGQLVCLLPLNSNTKEKGRGLDPGGKCLRNGTFCLEPVLFRAEITISEKADQLTDMNAP